MKIKAAPTRGNYMRLARSRRLAGRGRDLLEQKRRILMMELTRQRERARGLLEEAARLFSQAYRDLQRANLAQGIDVVEELAEAVPLEEGITVRLRSVLGVEVPEVDAIEVRPRPVYSFWATSGALDRAGRSFREALALTARLAEMESGLFRLAGQVRKTNRRVNSLEKVALPALDRALRGIAEALEEGEREDFVRMKRVQSLSSR
ncbi:V-type ATP synthase subunit D [Aminithiophilus ramosus]|uniref:V-type ATP synthase subunit D n=2 Tax=Synergistales TaxID=649776 RepID=A0A9Q7A638_9BACT|nr:V-type ATP synthase subunit D [Aminithiophilus ramosus]QTX31725.1 V-type ATP synthase subunit D [Aminithiophilus ramosus]QVL35548.1 V-type ATP synthase subunit D [Synergistota bacterium]